MKSINAVNLRIYIFLLPLFFLFFFVANIVSRFCGNASCRELYHLLPSPPSVPKESC